MSAITHMRVFFKNELLAEEKMYPEKSITLQYDPLYDGEHSFIRRYNLIDFKSDKYTSLNKKFDIPLEKLYEIIGSSRKEALAKCKKNIYGDGSMGYLKYTTGITRLNQFFDEIEKGNEIESILVERKEY